MKNFWETIFKLTDKIHWSLFDKSLKVMKHQKLWQSLYYASSSISIWAWNKWTKSMTTDKAIANILED